MLVCGAVVVQRFAGAQRSRPDPSKLAVFEISNGGIWRNGFFQGFLKLGKLFVYRVLRKGHLQRFFRDKLNESVPDFFHLIRYDHRNFVGLCFSLYRVRYLQVGCVIRKFNCFFVNFSRISCRVLHLFYKLVIFDRKMKVSCKILISIL